MAHDTDTDTDMIKLYSQRILALAADIPHRGQLDAPDARIKKRAPLCGSTVTVDVEMKAGRVVAFAQEVKACALGQAAAALLGHNIIGRTRTEVDMARETLLTMLKSDAPPPGAPWEGFEVLEPARAYRNRHASIMLALEATAQAMAEAERADCA